MEITYCEFYTSTSGFFLQFVSFCGMYHSNKNKNLCSMYFLSKSLLSMELN